MDPAVVNLTDFETFFPEKRPFFVEGAQIFDNFGRNGANNYYGFMRTEPDLFYTRRIGRAPQGYPEAEFVVGPARHHDPRRRQVHREERVGVERRRPRGGHRARAGAVAATATTAGRQEVEPLTNYFVLRAHRDRTRAGYGVLLTAVNRDLGDPLLASQLARSAYVGGLDGYLFLDAAEGLGGVRAGGRRARSPGDREAIEGLQLASARYFQRPDRPELRLDPTRTALGGWTGSLNLNRQSGAVRVNAAAWATSPGFESNDLGFNPRSDRWGGHVALRAAASPSRTASRGSDPSPSPSRTRTTSTATSRATPSTSSGGRSSATTGTRASTAPSAGAGSTTARRAAGPP